MKICVTFESKWKIEMCTFEQQQVIIELSSKLLHSRLVKATKYTHHPIIISHCTLCISTSILLQTTSLGWNVLKQVYNSRVWRDAWRGEAGPKYNTDQPFLNAQLHWALPQCTVIHHSALTQCTRYIIVHRHSALWQSIGLMVREAALKGNRQEARLH